MTKAKEPSLFPAPKTPRRPPFRSDDPPRLTPPTTGRRPPIPRRAKRNPPLTADTRSLQRDCDGRYRIEPDRAIRVAWCWQWTGTGPDRGVSVCSTHPISVVTGFTWSRLTVNEARALQAQLTAVLADPSPPEGPS